MNVRGKIAAISPCIAKTDEFRATGLVQYNVTMAGLQKYIISNNIDIGTYIYEGDVFDGGYGLEGAVYPRPGGLKSSLEYHNRKLNVINTEGAGRVYKSLGDYCGVIETYRPDVFDVLNCESGCNGGPGTGVDYEDFKARIIMNNVEQEAHASRKHHSILGIDRQFARFDRKLSLEDFLRSYEDEDIDKRTVSLEELEEVYRKLHKYSEADRHHNCHACGFASCQDMAEAIVKGINIPQNCHQFTLREIEGTREKIRKVNQDVISLVAEFRGMFENLRENINSTEHESESIRSLGNDNTNKLKVVMNHMEQLRTLNENVTDAVEYINDAVTRYRDMTNEIENISRNINILSLNASIEAGRAGECGKSFAVVAHQIRDLSGESECSVAFARDNESLIVDVIDNINTVQGGIGKEIDRLSGFMNDMAVSIDSTSESSVTIQESMNRIKEMSEQVEKIIERTNNYVE